MGRARATVYLLLISGLDEFCEKLLAEKLSTRAPDRIDSKK